MIRTSRELRDEFNMVLDDGMTVSSDTVRRLMKNGLSGREAAKNLLLRDIDRSELSEICKRAHRLRKKKLA